MTPKTDRQNDRDRFRITIEIEPTNGGNWKAFEPSSNSDLSGRGKTPPEAVENYALALRPDTEIEAPAND